MTTTQQQPNLDELTQLPEDYEHGTDAEPVNGVFPAGTVALCGYVLPSDEPHTGDYPKGDTCPVCVVIHEMRNGPTQ